MYKIIINFTFLFIINLPLSAMDLNETTTIINEAKKATESLQNEFNILTQEVISPIKKDFIEDNTSILETVSNIENIESNISHELNNTNETNNTNNVEELNTTIEVNCEDENFSIENNESNFSLEINASIPDNGCSHTEIEGSSIRGLIIFRDEIKPFCEMTGEAFAKQYMQEDWDEIYQDKEFKMELFKACPNVEKIYKDEWTAHLYQFALEYASDSDAIPEC